MQFLSAGRGALQLQIGGEAISLVSAGDGGGGGESPLSTILAGLGLTTNLKLCLDAGDAASYSSGQSWLDLSGGGYDFFRGTTSGSDGSDPTFNGSAGGLSSAEYWSFDGGDYFTYDTSNETWMDNLHKDNAIASWVAWVYLGGTGTSRSIFGTSGNLTAGNGFNVYLRSGNTYRCLVQAGGLVMSADTTATPGTPSGAWTFFCGALNEATGASGCDLGFGTTSVTYETFTSTYTSPASTAAAQTLQIGATGNGNAPLPSGSRMAEIAIWEGTRLTQANMTAIHAATKGRFGL